MTVIVVIAFIFSLKYYSRHRAFRVLPYYFGAWIVMVGQQFYWYISPFAGRYAHVLHAIAAAFTVFEFCVFSLLILHFIAGAGRRFATKLIAVSLSIAEIFLYFRMVPRNPVVLMGLLEAGGVMLLCAVYYYELFTDMNTTPLKDRPSFWIVTGIICQNTYNTSLVLSMEYMGRFSDGAYTFGILFYCLLFVLFMRAYKCQPEEKVVA